MYNFKPVAHYKSYQRKNVKFSDEIVSGNVTPKRVGDIKRIYS